MPMHEDLSAIAVIVRTRYDTSTANTKTISTTGIGVPIPKVNLLGTPAPIAGPFDQGPAPSSTTRT